MAGESERNVLNTHHAHGFPRLAEQNNFQSLYSFRPGSTLESISYSPGFQSYSKNFVHRQRQGPSCTLSCGATMVLDQDTWFGRRSDSPVLTFWRLEFSLNEHGVAPTGLQQPNVGLFLIRAGELSQFSIAAVASDLIATWPHKQKSFKIDCSPMPSVTALTTAAISDSPLLQAKTPIVLDHAFTN